MGIGQRLKRLRTQRNLTQEALSELTGCSAGSSLPQLLSQS